MVRDIIKGKLNDGQLNQCALTFRDLDVIASAFATILVGAKHYRLPYPEQLAKELAVKTKKAEKEAEKALDKTVEKAAEKTADEKPAKESEDA